MVGIVVAGALKVILNESNYSVVILGGIFWVILRNFNFSSNFSSTYYLIPALITSLISPYTIKSPGVYFLVAVVSLIPIYTAPTVAHLAAFLYYSSLSHYLVRGRGYLYKFKLFLGNNWILNGNLVGLYWWLFIILLLSIRTFIILYRRVKGGGSGGGSGAEGVSDPELEEDEEVRPPLLSERTKRPKAKIPTPRTTKRAEKLKKEIEKSIRMSEQRG